MKPPECNVQGFLKGSLKLLQRSPDESARLEEWYRGYSGELMYIDARDPGSSRSRRKSQLTILDPPPPDVAAGDDPVYGWERTLAALTTEYVSHLARK